MAKVVIEVEQIDVSNFDEFNDLHSKMVELVESTSPTPSYNDVQVETTNDGLTFSWTI